MRIICLIGPSASGKTTISRMMGAEVVSLTSRPPRPGERDGVDYYFRSREEIKKMHEDGKLIEFNKYNGDLYAVSVEEIKNRLRMHRRVFLVVELNGLLQIKDSIYGDKVFTVFVHAEPETILKRMRARGQDPEDIARRMVRLSAEYKHAAYADMVLNNNGPLGFAVECLRKVLKG